MAALRRTGIDQVEHVVTSNRHMLEKALQMRAQSYLADVKAQLLTSVIFEIDSGRKKLLTAHQRLQESMKTISAQKDALAKEVGQRRKATQELEREIIERKQAETRLVRAQKMEAVGQLTGGVAHDFNNLLAVIQGNTELLADQASEDATTKRTGPILRAAERGSELTHRLLAFSRQQHLLPQAIDVAALIDDLSDLLAQTLGAATEIEKTVAPDLWRASADPGEVENVIMNIVNNARDAMPDGGKLTIECANTRFDESTVAREPELVAGDYVMLAIGDTGSGMSTEVQTKAFEPFFTTKEVGQGSGLGLPMVYGFVKQSGGHVVIDSEEGHGTTIKLYLPRADGDTRSPNSGD